MDTTFTTDGNISLSSDIEISDAILDFMATDSILDPADWRLRAETNTQTSLRAGIVGQWFDHPDIGYQARFRNNSCKVEKEHVFKKRRLYDLTLDNNQQTKAMVVHVPVFGYKYPSFWVFDNVELKDRYVTGFADLGDFNYKTYGSLLIKKFDPSINLSSYRHAHIYGGETRNYDMGFEKYGSYIKIKTGPTGQNTNSYQVVLLNECTSSNPLYLIILGKVIKVSTTKIEKDYPNYRIWINEGRTITTDMNEVTGWDLPDSQYNNVIIFYKMPE